MSAKLLMVPAVLGVMALAGTAHAAPIGMISAAATLNTDAATAAVVENVHYRRYGRYGYYSPYYYYYSRPAPRVFSFYVRPRSSHFYGYRRFH